MRPFEAAITAAAQATSPAVAGTADGSSRAEISAVEELRRVANLGPKSAAILAAAGVRSFEHLRQLGSVAAYVLAKQSGTKVTTCSGRWKARSPASPGKPSPVSTEPVCCLPWRLANGAVMSRERCRPF